MDIGLTPTSTKSGEDTEADVPHHTQTHPIKLLSFANGAFYHHHREPMPTPRVLAFKECMKNHAAAIGGHAVDGCAEFMPPPSTDPTSLKCAACGCHRNFHRREPNSPPTTVNPPFFDFQHPPQPKRSSLSPSPPPLHRMLALSTVTDRHHAPVTPIGEIPAGRKRFRSKFNREQKEKMRSFSEKLGWKMQKCDENSIVEFCNEIGIARGVLKVWMHNNKNTIGKADSGNRGSIVNVNDGIIDFGINGGSGSGGRKTDNGSQFGGGIRFHGSNNGSSSSN